MYKYTILNITSPFFQTFAIFMSNYKPSLLPVVRRLIFTRLSCYTRYTKFVIDDDDMYLRPECTQSKKRAPP